MIPQFKMISFLNIFGVETNLLKKIDTQPAPLYVHLVECKFWYWVISYTCRIVNSQKMYSIRKIEKISCVKWLKLDQATTELKGYFKIVI
jgi:hypothetical protein